MKRYDKYKNTGVEWIGEIPEHWEVRKLKYLGRMYSGLTNKKGDDFSKEFKGGFFPFIPFTNIFRNNKISETEFQFVRSNEYDTQNEVAYNDILFLMSSETFEDIGKNSIYLGREKVFLNSFCKGFRIFDKSITPLFINYLLLSKTYREYFASVGRGFTRINIKQEYVLDMPVLYFSLEEQTAIASFLDEKTAKIDQTIAIRQKEIELLKERRQIIIQKAVTQGLDTNVKLKDSGIDWIGQIPEHWEVRKLKYVFNLIKTGTTPQTSREDYFKGDINWFNPKDLNNEILCEAEKKISELAIRDKEIKTFPGNSILIVGIGATSGKTSYLLNEATFNQQITGFHSIDENNKFYYYFFKSITDLMLNLANYTTLPILNNEFFKSFLTIKLPLEEQTAIVSYLEEIEEKIAKAISLKEQEIEKLKEYKIILIDNVVTGKIKVN